MISRIVSSYVVHQLRTGGFEVRFTYPNLLYISWKHYEQEYMREQNPITQAMKPPAANTSKKGLAGKRGMGSTTQKVTFAPDLSRIGGAPAAARFRGCLSAARFLLGWYTAPDKAAAWECY